jgi:hypothetical protein
LSGLRTGRIRSRRPQTTGRLSRPAINRSAASSTSRPGSHEPSPCPEKGPPPKCQPRASEAAPAGLSRRRNGPQFFALQGRDSTRRGLNQASSFTTESPSFLPSALIRFCRVSFHFHFVAAPSFQGLADFGCGKCSFSSFEEPPYPGALRGLAAAALCPGLPCDCPFGAKQIAAPHCDSPAGTPGLPIHHPGDGFDPAAAPISRAAASGRFSASAGQRASGRFPISRAAKRPFPISRALRKRPVPISRAPRKRPVLGELRHDPPENRPPVSGAGASGR